MLDLGTNTTKSHVHLSDLIKLSSPDGGYDPVTMRKPALGDGGVALPLDGEDGSGASTPPLWRLESPESRRRNYAALSPKSRSEAIAKGQMELMEMVKNMPEACYELSLKDLVEVNRGIGHDRLIDQGKGRDGNHARWGGGRLQRQHRHNGGQMVRSGSLDGNSGAFLLKMVLPVPWRTRKKKKKKIGGLDANSGNNGVNSNIMVPEKEWWRTRVWRSTSARGESAESSGGESSSLTSGSRKSSNGSSSRNSWTSSSNNNSSRRYELDIDCWSFIRSTNKSRSSK